MSTMLATGAALGLGGLQTRLTGDEPAIAAQGSGGGVPPIDPELATQVKGYDYFPEFRHSKDGGKVKNLTPEQLAAAGLTRETWTLDVVSEKDPLLGKPRSRAAGNAITFAEVQRLYEERPVRVLKVTTCLMGAAANHRGIWEGVALRDVLWLAQPTGAIRRVAFHALNSGDPAKQQWCSSLPPARIFEDPPGLAPVILALKFNDQWLEPKHGGPVRLIVQEHYGFKNTRHLQRVMFTTAHAATDDYAKIGQDVESPMKTVVQSLSVKGKCPADKPLVAEGIIQVGFSGLKGVQYATVPADAPLPADDPYCLKLPWQDGVVIPPPPDFAAKIPGGPKGVFGLDPATGAPITWPIPGYCAFWGAVIRGLKPGKYKIYARAINRNGDAQPLPRPFDNSGVSRLPSATVEITA
jgi:DMSO/TMAO reductase YedYZ molybdopterin-dependent catalytic subunit